MANKDYPRGFFPVRHASGGEIRTRHYILTTGEEVFKGELIKAVAGGTVETAAADIGVAAIGVAAEYMDGTTAGTEVAVYDDPQIVFGVQADGTIAATAVFATGNHVAGAGVAATGCSADEFDASDIGTGAQLEVIGKIERIDNAWGTHCDLEVMFNEHKRKAAVAGI